MTLFAFVGHARTLNAREAGALAARQVLEQIGREPSILGFVFASSYLPMGQVVSGVSSLLGDIPLIGASSAGEFANFGADERSVAVAVLAGEEIKSQAVWADNYQVDSFQATIELLRRLKARPGFGTLFITADGLYGDANQLCRTLTGQNSLVGCLAGAHFRHTQTYQVGGRDSGASGLAAAFLDEEIICGVGTAHGWQPVGESFKVTEIEGSCILSLDGKAPIEAYSSLFGYPARNWTVPPLNELVRLYPFGMQSEVDNAMIVRSPLRVEAYGTLRMQAPVSEHAIGHLMVGSREGCLAAAERAAREALAALNGAKPVLAIVLTDVSWRMLMKTQPGSELRIIKDIVGADLPLVGGYMYGQLVGKAGAHAELFNQHIEVILLGKVN
jgi:hypothetical protein